MEPDRPMSILDLNTVFANMSVENDQSENNNNSDQIKNKSSLRHLTSPCYLRAADTTFENSVLLASHQAYHAFWSRICHAILHYTQKIEIDSTQYFYAGKFRWHWSVFVHGIRKNGKRDRSIWARHSICTPSNSCGATLPSRATTSSSHTRKASACPSAESSPKTNS